MIDLYGVSPAELGAQLDRLASLTDAELLQEKTEAYALGYIEVLDAGRDATLGGGATWIESLRRRRRILRAPKRK
jgi:hypothetical protein